MNLSQLFHDIEPIPQDDGPHPVCAIDYPEKFVEAMNYLRALIDIDEHSERALELTALCLRYNPANYTTWWYRRQCLSALSKKVDDDNDDTNTNAHTMNANNEMDNTNNDKIEKGKDEKATYYNIKRIIDDLELASILGGSNPKNYQVWYHRRSLLDFSFRTIRKELELNRGRGKGIGDQNDIDDDNNNDDDNSQTQKLKKEEEERVDNDSDDNKDINEDNNSGLMTIVKDELKYIAMVLAEDSKNYHAWSHRQWIIKTVNDPTLWSNELEFSNQLIEEDVRNNSAWNQRWFASHFGNKFPPLSMVNAKSEADYAIKIIAIDPHNESPLRYLIAILREQHKLSSSNGKSKGKSGGEEEEGKEFVSFLNNVEVKIDNLKETLNNGNECSSLISAYIDVLEMKNDSKSFERGADMANDLGTKFDIVRRKYWLMREGKLRSKALKIIE